MTADGRAVCVFEVDGEPRAYAGTCLHRGTSLAGGFVRDGIVMCPGHWWRYDLRTGEVTDRPGERLEGYPVEEEDGRLVAVLPPAPPRPASIRDRLLAAGRAWQAQVQRAAAGSHTESDAGEAAE